MRGVGELANDGSNWPRTSLTIPWMSVMDVLAGVSVLVLVPGRSAPIDVRGDAIIERKNN